jgi:TrkA domain protein
MTVYESELPGVGKKFEVEIGDGERLVVVIHNTGQREVFHKASEDADAERLFDLPDRLARQVGSILEGTHFQPVQTDRIETMLAEGTFLEWYGVEETAELAGTTIADANVRQRTGASIVAIERDEEVIPSPAPDTRIEAGDTVVVIGAREDIHAFGALVSGPDAGEE